MTSDEATVQQIRADLEAVAKKWKIEHVYHQHVDGTIQISTGVVITATTAQPPPGQEAEPRGGT